MCSCLGLSSLAFPHFQLLLQQYGNWAMMQSSIVAIMKLYIIAQSIALYSNTTGISDNKLYLFRSCFLHMSRGSYIHQTHCRSLPLELCVVCMIVNQCYQMELEVVKQLTTSSVRDTLITDLKAQINCNCASSIRSAGGNGARVQSFVNVDVSHSVLRTQIVSIINLDVQLDGSLE